VEKMLAAGIDVGSGYCKCIVLKDNEIIGKILYPIEGDPLHISKKALIDALNPLQLKLKQVKNVVSTGRNRKKIPIDCEERTELICIAKGAHQFVPSIRTIIDIGAITNKAIKISDAGKVMEYVINDKCASGSGMFLELVAKALEMDISELGKKAVLSKNPISITNQCSIFAESEVIYLVNEGKDGGDIAAGVCNSIAGQLYSLLKRLRLEEDVALSGGVANNEQIRKNLEERLNFPIKRFPIDPSYIAAYGAALIATEL
jgi:predicted CoA-substrate-specific enzyme activase